MVTLKNFAETLHDVKLHDVPIASELKNGVSVVDKSALAAFEYAGNWYVAPKANGQIPTDPKQWSLVVNSTGANPNTEFYHQSSPGTPLTETHRELVYDIGTGLSFKREAGALPESRGNLTPDQIKDIILSKEKAGSGLQEAARPQRRKSLTFGDAEAEISGAAPLNQFIAENGIDAFRANQDDTRRHLRRPPNEMAAQAEARAARIAEQRLSLKEAGNSPFMAARGTEIFHTPPERIFYKFEPESRSLLATEREVRRLKVGFDEMLTPQGERYVAPHISETTIPLSQAMQEIGGATIGHVPEGISAHLKGDREGIGRYAKIDLAHEYNWREKLHNEIPLQSPVHHLWGEEVAGKELTSETWHRVVRPEDYVMQAGRPEGHRVLDKSRADYFLVREHPDYTAALSNLSALDYKGPAKEILFLKGDPTGKTIGTIESIGCSDHDGEIMMELRRRGVTADTKLLKVGQDEYAELFHRRELKSRIADAESLRHTARDAIPTKPLRYYRLNTDRPLTTPIALDAAGKLTGDVEKLRVGGLYKLGDDHFVHVHDRGFGNHRDYRLDVYKKTPAGMLRVAEDMCDQEGALEYRLTGWLRTQGGKMTDAAEHEVFELANHLSGLSKAGTQSAWAEKIRLQSLISAEKPLYPENMAQRLRQAAAGTLECHYKSHEKAMGRWDHPADKRADAPGRQRTSSSTSSGERGAETSNRKPPASARSDAADASRSTDAARDSERASESRRRSGAARRSERTGASKAKNAAKSESGFSRFMEKEKWWGKKGLVFGGAAVTVGAIIYGVKSYIEAHRKNEDDSWQQQVTHTPDAQPGMTK